MENLYTSWNQQTWWPFSWPKRIPISNYESYPQQPRANLSNPQPHLQNPEYVNIFLKDKSLKFIKPSSILKNLKESDYPLVTIGRIISYKKRTPSYNCFAIVHQDTAEKIKKKRIQIQIPQTLHSSWLQHQKQSKTKELIHYVYSNSGGFFPLHYPVFLLNKSMMIFFWG